MKIIATGIHSMTVTSTDLYNTTLITDLLPAPNACEINVSLKE